MKELAILTRHFLNRYIHSDLSGPDRDIGLAAGNILVLLAIPGVVYCVGLAQKYSWLAWHLGDYRTTLYHPASLGDKFLFITLAVVVVGFLTVLRWDMLFPDLCDYMILTPLPVGTFCILAAKSASLLIVLAILALTLNLLTSILYPVMAMANNPSFREMLHSVWAHAISVFGASLFVYLLMLCFHGILLSLLGHRWFRRVSPYMQFLALFWLGNQFLAVAVLDRLIQRLQQGSIVGWAFPTLWFLGLYEKLLGQPDPVFLPLAHRAQIGLASVAALAAGVYVAGYARHLLRSLESSTDTATRSAWPVRLWLSAADRWLVRDPQERATFHFVWQTVMRSATHRLFLSAYVGLGTAIVLEGLAALLIGLGSAKVEGMAVALYSLPLMLSFFVLSGLRVIFAVPTEIGANWIFQLAEDDQRGLLLAGARKATLWLAITPLFAMLLVVYVCLWGWFTAILYVAYCVALSWLLLEGLMWNFPKVPFTCAYQPGRINLPIAGLLCMVAFSVYAYTMASFGRWLIEEPVKMLVFYGLFGGVLAVVSSYRERQLETDWRLLFDEPQEPEVQTLAIGSRHELR